MQAYRSNTMINSNIRRTCLLTPLFVLNGVNGFLQLGSNSLHQVAFRPSPLAALVYGPDGVQMEDEDWNDIEDELQTLKVTGDTLGMSHLSQEQIGALARMAAAFSPPGQQLDIAHINDIEVLSVGRDSIEISAVVCETDGCITARVPITFPSPCPVSDGLDKCISNNLGHLDQQAQGVVREMELKKENKDDDEYITKILTSKENIEYPTWWEPATGGMVDDCDSIVRLLNEDGFQAEIRGVATKALMEVVDHKDNFKVQRTAVIAVCPVGLHMRALVKRQTSMFGEEEEKFMQVPLAFKQTATDGDALRNEVLRTVDSASIYVE